MITRIHKVNKESIYNCKILLIVSDEIKILSIMHISYGIYLVPLSCSCYCERSGQSCQRHHEARGKIPSGPTVRQNMLILLNTCYGRSLFLHQDNFQKLIQVQCRLNGHQEIVQPGRVRSYRCYWELFVCVILLLKPLCVVLIFGYDHRGVPTCHIIHIMDTAQFFSKETISKIYLT